MEDAFMAKPLVTDDVWAVIEPLLPERRVPLLCEQCGARMARRTQEGHC